MKKSKLIAWFICLVLVAAVALSGCGQSTTNGNNDGNNDSNSSGEYYRLSIATGGTSGAFYFVGTGIANVINRDIDNAELVVESTSASVENARLVALGEVDLALTTTEESFKAYEAIENHSDAEKGKVLAIRNSHTAFSNLFTIDPNIKTFNDLKGKRVALGAPGSFTALRSAPAHLEAHGMTMDDIQAEYLHYGEAISAMKDGNLDAAFAYAGMPVAALLELQATHNMYFIPIGQEEMEKLNELHPYGFATYLPANTYQGQEEAVLMEGVGQVLVVSADLPEDLVYEITKATDISSKVIAEAHPAGKEWTHETVKNGIIIPFHPGAERYWREVGVID